MAQNIKVAADFIRGSYLNHLAFGIENNPRGVYDFIKTTFPGEFVDNWTLGVEGSDNAKEQLLNFLDAKAKASGNPDQFTYQVLKAIPYQRDTENWTKIQ